MFSTVRLSGVLAAFAAAAFSATPDRAIAILQQRCQQCHGETMDMSGLRLNSREAVLKGGKHGPAIQAGDSSKSRLYQAVTAAIQPSMPPGKPLAAEEIAVLKEWIDSGAVWPDKVTAAPKSQWWAFQKPKRPVVPVVTGALNPIDAFVLSKLQSKQLKPSPEADRQTLVRRAYYDLHGLPPTAEQARAFVSDRSVNAYEKLIDELLASPRYGEKWGRHWLDLVRYADTAGFEQDPYLLDAWRFRDWVIQSFNNDKPYDRFVKEQLAADELWPDSPEACMGTGYFCVGPNRDMLFKVEEQNRTETLQDYVDTTSSVFLGLSVGCARCHDHKFDPIPQKDYYRMQAIFAPAAKTRVLLDYNPAKQFDLKENSRQVRLRQIGDELERLMSASRRRVLAPKLVDAPPALREALNTEPSKRTPEQIDLVAFSSNLIKVSDDEVRAGLSQEENERLRAIEKRLSAMYTSYAPPPMAPGIMDMGREAPRTFVAVRGNPSVRGEQVQPGFLQALGGGDVPEPPEEANTTFRRKALAEWIANPENPMTARVMVNRMWQFLMGRGIVATPSDYGVRGMAPSHPELLDWLATEFVARGWSMKQMHKLIMTSAAYKRSSVESKEAKQSDPENILLSHMNRRRLEAEEIRDSVLAVSGDLSLKMEGMPVVPPLGKDELYGITGDPGNAWVVTSDVREHNRRSVYLLSRRAFRAPMFELFDSPDGIMSCSRRDSSTIAPQSLTMLNGRFTVDQAKSLTDKLRVLPAADRIEKAWEHVLSRKPTADEQSAAVQFLARQQKNLGSEPAAMQELVRSLLNLNEFLYVD